MSASTVTLPDCMIGEATSAATVNNIHHTFGKTVLERREHWRNTQHTVLAGLKITVFPIRMAGISIWNVSLSG
jgi:hypothetical protein